MGRDRQDRGFAGALERRATSAASSGRVANEWCEAPECDRPTKEGRKYCDAHYKQAQRGRPLTPITEKLPPEDRFLQAADAWVNTPAEDDDAYERNRKAAYAAARAAVGSDFGRAVSEGMAAARERGVRLGRPRKVEGDRLQLALRLVDQVGVTAAAKLLGVHRANLSRAVREAKGGISRRRSEGDDVAERSISRQPMRARSVSMGGRSSSRPC